MQNENKSQNLQVSKPGDHVKVKRSVKKKNQRFKKKIQGGGNAFPTLGGTPAEAPCPDILADDLPADIYYDPSIDAYLE